MTPLIRTIQLHLAAQHESPSRMAGRGPRPQAGMCYIPGWKSSHRGLQPAERTTRIHADDAGCGPGLAAGRRRRNAGRRGTGGAGGGDARRMRNLAALGVVVIEAFRFFQGVEHV